MQVLTLSEYCERVHERSELLTTLSCHNRDIFIGTPIIDVSAVSDRFQNVTQLIPLQEMIHKWWHRFVRKRTKPIPEDTAVLWKQRLSIAYGLLAWNAFGFVVYNVYKGKADWAHYYGIKSDEEHSTPPGEAWAQTLGIKNAKVYRISGLKKVDEYDIIDGQGVRTDGKDNSPDNENLSE